MDVYKMGKPLQSSTANPIMATPIYKTPLPLQSILGSKIILNIVLDQIWKIDRMVKKAFQYAFFNALDSKWDR